MEIVCFCNNFAWYKPMHGFLMCHVFMGSTNRKKNFGVLSLIVNKIGRDWGKIWKKD